MIRGKIILLFIAVILLTASAVYHFTKQAYETPAQEQPPHGSPITDDIAVQQALPQNSSASAQASKVDISLTYAGAEKSHYFALMRFSLPEGTKTYWKKAGFGGISPEFDLSASTNLRDFEVFWGTPKKFTTSGITNYILPPNKEILIKISPDVISQPVHLKGVFHYGYCDTQCKAGTKNIDLILNSQDNSNIGATERYDLLKTEPSPLPEKKADIKIFDLKGKIDRNSHIISFTFEAEKPFREENLFYSFDIDDYEITKPLIQNIYEGRRRITIDMIGLGETPQEIDIIYVRDDGTSIIKKERLAFEKYQ